MDRIRDALTYSIYPDPGSVGLVWVGLGKKSSPRITISLVRYEYVRSRSRKEEEEERFRPVEGIGILFLEDEPSRWSKLEHDHDSAGE
jgi:hypothetical protein